MDKNYDISEFDSGGFLHSRIKHVEYYHDKKKMLIQMHAADLRNGEYITTVALSITDWWNFEVQHIKGHDIVNVIKEPDIPELDGIIDYEYDGNTLMLEDLCGRDEVYRFIFLNPKIKITGEYEPD